MVDSSRAKEKEARSNCTLWASRFKNQ